MIEIVRNLESFLTLEKEWNRLAAGCTLPLLSHACVCAAAGAFADADEELLIVLVRSPEGRLTAAAPLKRSGGQLVRRLVILGSLELGEPAGLLYENPEALRELLAGVLGLGYPLQLNRISGDALEEPVLKEAARLRGVAVARPDLGSFWLPIQTDWRGFEKAMPGRRRQRLRRARNLAEQIGTVSFKVGRVPAAEALNHLRELEQVELLSWKAAAGTALPQDERFRRFYARLCAAAAETGSLVGAAMHIDGAPAAAQLGLLHRERLWLLKASFAEKCARCSPGILLMHEMVRWAFENNLTAVEFLGMQEPWIEIWSRARHEYRTLYAHGLNWRSLVDLGLHACSWAARSIMPRCGAQDGESHDREKLAA